MDKPDKLHGQKLLIYMLANIVKNECDCNLVRQRLIDKQPKYPFVTFNWIVVDQEITQDWLGSNRPIYSQLQIDVHSDDYLQAMELANKLFFSLKRDKYQLCLQQVEMTATRLTTVEDRTTSPEVNYDYCFGFDCTFLINNSNDYKLSNIRFDFEETEIKSVKIKGKADNKTDLDINKTEEK